MTKLRTSKMILGRSPNALVVRVIAMALVIWPVANLAIAQLSEVPARDAEERVEFFEKKIRPVLVEHCY